jgi:hypothetical protein
MNIEKIKGIIEAVEHDIKNGEAFAGHLNDCYLKFMKEVVAILSPLSHKAEEIVAKIEAEPIYKDAVSNSTLDSKSIEIKSVEANS